jgi:hypothetical protein
MLEIRSTPVRLFCVALLSLASATALAKPSPAAVEAAKKAATGIAAEAKNKDLTLATQVKHALNELADKVYDLPERTRKVLSSLADVEDQSQHAKDPDQALDEEAKAFLKDACGTDKTADLLAQSVSKLVTTCHLKDRKAVPSTVTPAMRPGAVLLAAFVIDQLGKDATADERTIALWIAHYGRSDGTKAKPVAKP